MSDDVQGVKTEPKKTDTPEPVIDNNCNGLDGLNAEVLEKLIGEKEDLSKWFQSKVDQRVKQAVDTRDEKWEKEKLPKIWEEREAKLRQELLPEETPAEKAQKDMQKQINTMKEEIQREKLEKFAIQYANSHGLEDISLLVSNLNLKSENQIKDVFSDIKSKLDFQFDRGKNHFLKTKGSPNLKSGDDKKPIFASMRDYQDYLNGHPERYNKEEYLQMVEKFGT